MNEEDETFYRFMNLARKQMREWERPSMTMNEIPLWEKWAFGKAYELVTQGRVDGEFRKFKDGRLGYVLTKTVGVPIMPQSVLSRQQEGC